MTTKVNETSLLTQALLETANDMHDVGILGNDACNTHTLTNCLWSPPVSSLI